MAHFLDADESTHRPGPDRFWTESFYFNFFDPLSGLAGATRIGFFPNRDHREGFLLLHLPDDTCGFVRLHAPSDPNEHGSAGQSVEASSLRFECIAPMRTWRVRYSGSIFVSRDPTVFGDPARLLC